MKGGCESGKDIGPGRVGTEGTGRVHEGKRVGRPWGCVRAGGGSREGVGGVGGGVSPGAGRGGGGARGAGPGPRRVGERAGPRCPSLAGRRAGRMAPGVRRGGCEQRAPGSAVGTAALGAQARLSPGRAPSLGAAPPRSRKMWGALLRPLLWLLLLLSPWDGVHATQPQGP